MDALHGIDTQELITELRNRRIDPAVLTDGLRLPKPQTASGIRGLSERQLALLVTSLFTFVLIVVLCVMAIRGTELPQFLIGLTGTGFGAIVGIFAGGATSGDTQAGNQTPAPS